MPARTGRQYLDGLREQEREVWLGGERVRDVTRHQGLKNGAARRRPALRHAARREMARCDDLCLAQDRRPGRPVVHHPEDPRGSRTAQRDDAGLGADHLRHDGAVAGFHERDLRRLGRGRGVLRPGPAGIRREHRALLRIHPRKRPDPDPRADQSAAQPHRLRRLQPPGRNCACRSCARPMPASSCAVPGSWRPWGRSPTRSASIRRAWRATPKATARSR